MLLSIDHKPGNGSRHGGGGSLSTVAEGVVDHMHGELPRMKVGDEVEKKMSRCYSF